MKDQAQQEKRAAADAAKSKATEARSKATASPDDAALQTAATEAETEATRLESEAQALSHDTKPERHKSDKIKKRMEILKTDLRAALIAEGKDPDEMTDEELEEEREAHDDEDDDDKPLTRGEAKKIGIIKTAEQLASQIANPDLKAAVLEELRFISTSVPAEQRYQKAISLASSSKNSKIASEAARIGQRSPQQHASGGAAARDDEGDFKPTPMEQEYMRKYKLSQEDILKGRRDAQSLNFGPRSNQ